MLRKHSSLFAISLLRRSQEVLKVYLVYVEDELVNQFRSPVAADLFVKQLSRQGIHAHVVFDEGVC